MARLSVLILVLFLIDGQCKAEGLFEDGQEYQYTYQAYTMTGVHEPSSFSSSFGIRGKLIIQKQPGIAILKLSDLTLGMHNGADTLFNTVKFLKKPDLTPLEKPFKVTFLNGKITGFYTDSWDAEWSVNFKKALATNLQMDFYIGDIGKEETAYMRIVEDTISGTCNTSYSFSDDGKGRFLLFKQRTQRECTNVPSVGFNTVKTTNCAAIPVNDILATSQSYYKLSGGTSSNTVKAESISSFGYQALQLYPPIGTPFYNKANTTLVLKSLVPIAKPISAPSLTKHYSSLRYTFRNSIPTPDGLDLTHEEDYFHPEEPQSQLVLRNKAVPMLTKLKNVIGWSPLNEEGLLDSSSSDCIQLMATLSLESLHAVWKSIEKDEELKNLYVEILPLTGTNPSALMIKALILGGKISDIEAQRVVAFIPYYLRMPSEKLLVNWEDLLKSSSSIKTKELKAAIASAFGHLIGVTCNDNKLRPCKVDTINKYARVLYDAFTLAKTHRETMVSLIALRNSKLLPAIERLVPNTKSGSVARAIRPHVIFSIQILAASNREKFLSAIMPIIHNMTEPTEIRVAAISTLFQAKPTFVELQELVGIIENENNKEVLNFILTTFRSYAESKNSCLESDSGDLQLLLRRVDYLKTDFFRSNNRAFDFRDEQYGFGGGLQLVTVYGEDSRAPLVISARVNYRLSKHRYVPLEIMIRLEGIDDAYVRFFHKLDPKDLKLDVLKTLLQKTLKIVPRQKASFKMDIILRSQGYDLLYYYMGGEELAILVEGKALKELLSRGFKLTRSMVLLAGQKVTWFANDIGIPVAYGISSPGFARHQLAYADQSQVNKIARNIQAGLDINLQMTTYPVTHSPLNGTQGIFKSRGSRIHLPINAQFIYSIPDAQIEIKMTTATEEKPLSFVFTSKTNAVLYGKEDSKAISYLKDTCNQCESNSLVTRGDHFRKGFVVRENINPLLGLESHLEVYDCEAYTGKASVAKFLYGSFKPSEINSHGSLPGFLAMGLMQMRHYFYLYPPVRSCSTKAVVHKSRENPAEAIEIKLKMDSSPPPWKRAAPGVTYNNVKGAMTLLGTQQRKWNFELNVEKEPLNIKSLVTVKIARLANPTLGVPSRSLCFNVKTIWSTVPQDLFETPSSVQPSVHQDVTFVWGEAPLNERPKANAKGISTITVKVVGNITDAQQEAAIRRNTYPYDRCDLDRHEGGRSGITGPMTQACYEAVLVYATPRHYKLDVKYENMSPRGQTFLDRMSTLLKPVFLPYLNTRTPLYPTKSVAGTGKMELKVDIGDHDVNLLVRSDHALSQFENVDILKEAGMLLRNARFQMWHLIAMKAGWIGVCDVAPQEVMTFDNVKTNYDLSSCYTLLSADCSPTPRYAIFAKKTNISLPLAVKIYVGGHTLEFHPILRSLIANNGVEIRADDKLVNVEANKPYVLSDKNNITQYAVVNFVGARYFIQIPILQLTLRYTGDDITAMIPAIHRAQHCGLCGDYNGQTSQEFVGPSGCILGNATDLARSYVLRDKICKETIRIPNCVNGSQKKATGIFSFFDRLIRS